MTDEELIDTWTALEPTGNQRRRVNARLASWLDAPAELRDQAREAIVAVARERYSWDGVARTVIDAAQGRLDGLPNP